MLPPGLSFNAVSDKAMKASETAGLIRAYWSWADMAGPNEAGYFPYTPATNLLYGLNEAIDMLHEEGLEHVFARHQRHGTAARAAVEAWGLEVLCRKASDRSPVLTAVMLPEGQSADSFRSVTLRHYDMSLGNGLSKLADRVFRIGHLGDFNDLMLIGTLAGVEMGLRDAGVPYRAGGVQAAMEVLGQTLDINRDAA
jgi:alanine-glyoxylate transaminase/serine-glyoxylate transaminase/serine-pyruvate transaminase